MISLNFHPDIYPAPAKAALSIDPKVAVLTYLRNAQEPRLVVTACRELGRSNNATRNLLEQLVVLGKVTKTYSREDANRSAYYAIATQEPPCNRG